MSAPGYALGAGLAWAGAGAPGDVVELANADAAARVAIEECEAAPLLCLPDRAELARAFLVHALATEVIAGRPDPVSVANAWAADEDVAREWGVEPPLQAADGWVLALVALEATEDIDAAPIFVRRVEPPALPVDWTIGAAVWQGTEIANRDADDINWPVQVGHRLELAIGFGVFAVRLGGGFHIEHTRQEVGGLGVGGELEEGSREVPPLSVERSEERVEALGGFRVPLGQNELRIELGFSAFGNGVTNPSFLRGLHQRYVASAPGAVGFGPKASLQGLHALGRVGFSWEATARYQRPVQHEHYVDAIKRQAMEGVELVEQLEPRRIAELCFGMGGGLRVNVPDSSVSVGIGVRLDLAYAAGDEGGIDGMAAPSLWEEVRWGGRSR